MASSVAGEPRVDRNTGFINGDSQIKSTERAFGLINILIIQLFAEYLFDPINRRVHFFSLVREPLRLELMGVF